MATQAIRRVIKFTGAAPAFKAAVDGAARDAESRFGSAALDVLHPSGIDVLVVS